MCVVVGWLVNRVWCVDPALNRSVVINCCKACQSPKKSILTTFHRLRLLNLSSTPTPPLVHPEELRNSNRSTCKWKKRWARIAAYLSPAWDLIKPKDASGFHWTDNPAHHQDTTYSPALNYDAKLFCGTQKEDEEEEKCVWGCSNEKQIQMRYYYRMVRVVEQVEPRCLLGQRIVAYPPTQPSAIYRIGALAKA